MGTGTGTAVLLCTGAGTPHPLRHKASQSAAATLTAHSNNLDSVRKVFEADKGRIAGVILEPAVGNSGYVAPTQEFLQGLRDATWEEGALLCFDEVVTGFRIAHGCAQQHFGITPDLTPVGKVIRGGLPVGAYGGRRDIMEMIAPAGSMDQAGTLSGNPLAMVAASRPGRSWIDRGCFSRPVTNFEEAAMNDKANLADGTAACLSEESTWRHHLLRLASHPWHTLTRTSSKP
ncbi:hypothetical protein WJX74_001344 [Apatococcus lobatus]|uniref:Glutamate-1-semialdehyde 2,1-aminomutase n=1 Tax=Apatococcus lobatus TaxID=904363 RepID=A0AAW1R1H4_9CHLO